MEVLKKIINWFKPKLNHHVDHRETDAYKTRLKIVKQCWIVGGVVLLILGISGVGIGILAGLLFGIFMTFVFLDEGEDNE